MAGTSGLPGAERGDSPGDYAIKLRLRLFTSQRAAAHHFGVEPGTISRYESEGITPMEVIGKPFDPREHEAVTNVPGTGRPHGEVVAELQRGYLIRDRVLRPAMVAVADGADAADTGGREQAPKIH